MTTQTSTSAIHVIGGGLAGSEAAWQIAQAGIPVVLHEMRPTKSTPAHQTGGLAELVCSNSFRADDFTANAVGLLHEEMRRLGSLIMQAATENRVPAGGALAVDRDGFSHSVERALNDHDLITISREEITDLQALDWDQTIVATGPLTSDALSQSIRALTGADQMAFFDAIAPIVYKDSIDFSKAWFQSRYDKGDGSDYINCAMDKEQYHAFIQALLDGEKQSFKDWEINTPYFEGCLPIEVMAERGVETLTFGPMKPVGLTNPNAPDKRSYAIVQLRQDNDLGTLWNMVGFQTKLAYGEQKRIFRTIPGLENAEFARLGGMHRNTFIKSPILLDQNLRLKSKPSIRFAGQITGCEGYVESTAIGLLAGRFASRERLDQDTQPPPVTTALGALLGHVTGGADVETYQPMNINFGLFPPAEIDDRPPEMRGKRLKRGDRKKARKAAVCARALNALEAWIKDTQP
ncbi:methylenetetrahydrofolate--tRNA-(uracil(54)-C(5))-methyltransferase (FADH(2)-oxidizing) TrmFO [Magnetovibrio blakemorei]|uniref:Methylenetetrahydrofolate--tRNA-(uracil-5-)-methyltransferase TrmFO n=1 Tax=Magnetovibrio blakemorei TaxID=28181 RepID=A0A1E5QBC7_9PROT|nr:methylenetetrahydrofolate--tRNA-(uracil(54)-C(5))-methyltransferase (FADH(2)-oxidizing) TrmFO [Magnetovibrio blakemorei]OEJ68897.1 methylenetetrahydrofolate--tRNA-(uracil(54)-C(5))-methyltransferase (FADH(2)-oxidizing) TrmFO [Magnetovibrio blakemorei]